MKLIHSLIILLTLASFTFISCDDDEKVIDTGDPLVLNASENSIILSEADKNKEAINFTWNKGLDRGPGTSITYCFKMDIAGNDFATSIPLEEMPEGVFSKSYTVEELNNLITEYWEINPGEAVELEAKIIARVEADKFIKPEVTTTAFNAKTYTLSSKPLYILGTAVTEGWNTANAIAMREVVISTKYTCKVVMEPGEYKFIETKESILPSYNKGKDDATLIYRTQESQPDNCFTIEEAGTYQLTVNLRTLEHECIYQAPYEHIYMVGDATPNEWDINNTQELVSIPNTPRYVYEGPMKKGEFKFPINESKWESSFFMPAVNYPPLTDNRIVLNPPNNGVDNKWKIETPGNYRITLDVIALTITIEQL